MASNITPADLTKDDWDTIEDGLYASRQESQDQADGWKGRAREARYLAEVARVDETLAKVRAIQATFTQGA